MKFGIIGAMQVEVETLIAKLSQVKTYELCGMTFFEGSLNGVSAVVVRCGIGKVNAALCAQTLISTFGVTHVINTGVAGSLDNQINIGDLVVSHDAVYHDFDITELGYQPGEVPGLTSSYFTADPVLVQVALAAAHTVAPQIGVFEGRVASGDQFVSSHEQKEKIVKLFGAKCAEMEGAAIAHTCTLNGVPFVIVRAISDKADGSAQVDYPTFEAAAAQTCASIVEHMVSR